MMGISIIQYGYKYDLIPNIFDTAFHYYNGCSCVKVILLCSVGNYIIYVNVVILPVFCIRVANTYKQMAIPQLRMYTHCCIYDSYCTE